MREEIWDVVVLDISLEGGRSGLDILKELRQIRPRTPILILSMHSEEQSPVGQSRQGLPDTSQKTARVRNLLQQSAR